MKKTMCFVLTLLLLTGCGKVVNDIKPEDENGFLDNYQSFDFTVYKEEVYKITNKYFDAVWNKGNILFGLEGNLADKGLFNIVCNEDNDLYELLMKFKAKDKKSISNSIDIEFIAEIINSISKKKLVIEDLADFFNSAGSTKYNYGKTDKQAFLFRKRQGDYEKNENEMYWVVTSSYENTLYFKGGVYLGIDKKTGIKSLIDVFKKYSEDNWNYSYMYNEQIAISIKNNDLILCEFLSSYNNENNLDNQELNFSVNYINYLYYEKQKYEKFNTQLFTEIIRYLNEVMLKEGDVTIIQVNNFIDNKTDNFLKKKTDTGVIEDKIYISETEFKGILMYLLKKEEGQLIENLHYSSWNNVDKNGYYR